MKMKLTGFFILLNCALFAQLPVGSQTSDQNPVIQTLSGAVQGVTEGQTDSFKGIPYAAPPVGEFRWRPPQPVQPWQGVRDATQYGSDCAQAGWPRTPGSIREGTSEDCLFLNVWRPAGISAKAGLPVMVWIHGGGFVGGSGSGPDYSGSRFPEQGVILVTVNYRLGRLGFFAFPALSKENPSEPTCNYAFMDQIAALKWVKENIAAFGGDPGNVTIFGESAGGVSVHSLLTISQAQGLFHKAIIESGGGRDGVLTAIPLTEANASRHYPVPAETIGVNFARKHGISGTDAVALASLRALSVEVIVDGGQESDGPGGLPIYSGPVMDGKLITETAESVYKAGRQGKIPIIIGSNSAEVPAGFVNAQTKEELISLFGSHKDEAQKAYDPDGNGDFTRILTLVNTDKVWAEPARFTAAAFASQGTPAYLYLFSYVPVPFRQFMRFGASHGSEIPYVFGNPRGWNDVKPTPVDFEVARLMNTYWSNFAKTGNPNGKGLPVWPVYDPEKNEVFEFHTEGTAGKVPDTRKARLDVIEKWVTE
ncbi:MAG: carboxylesterase family protein [Bacteroidetes bacterium]|nr:carboxylesterase family protein [Bacteroidota bacterium]